MQGSFMHVETTPGIEEITVHTFLHSDLEPQTSQTALRRGGDWAYAASTVEGWYYPNKPTDFSIFEFHNDCYQFYTHPPGVRSLVDEHDTRPVKVIKEWEGAISISNSEIYSSEHLEEFQSTSLDHIFQGSRRTSVLAPYSHIASTSFNVSDGSSGTVSRKRDHEKSKDSDLSNEPVNKRRRLDVGSLFKAIPWPHIYVCPVTSDRPSITKGTHAFYPKARPTPIWPHTLDTFNNYLGDRFVRGAWVVPVRGRLPWMDSTPAVVLAPQTTQVVLPAEPFLQECCEITWTWDALSQFWQFLISVRDARNVGPIGFSFHAAPSSQGASPAFGFDSRVSSDSHRAAASAGAPATTSQLFSVDHIKIYHATCYTILVRNILNAWSYKVARCSSDVGTDSLASGGIQEGTHTHGPSLGDDSRNDVVSQTKLRLLKGATLVLLDERSRGMLLC